MSEIIVGLITATAAVICQVIISISGRSAAQRDRHVRIRVGFLLISANEVMKWTA